ncbi:GNAT family N-acetyltransferase [Millisia brevis]|uniref:GNAT family N-acetyltransferase n=1 Tax=Millisia brevis TaxID=264148 RepID=UPI00082E7071|nr:GNAT family protein [Millisia brevis]
MTVLDGDRVRLRTATAADVDELAAIRAMPRVHRWWGGDRDTLVEETRADVEDDARKIFVVEYDGRTVGAIQWWQEDDDQYRHAGIDIFLDPQVHGRGLGSDAVDTMVRYLIETEGHHRLIIDPAADNRAAIACYESVGFRPVGVMRQYERGADGGWHDGLLMELLASDLLD